MANAITLGEWIETLAKDPREAGICLEFRILEIEDRQATVCPVIRAGVTDVWVGATEIVTPMSAISLSGFEMSGGDLVLRNLSVIL